MPALDRPQLRPYLAAAQDEREPNHVHVWDRLGLAGTPVRLSLLEFMAVQMFDGRRSLREIQFETMNLAGGQLIPLDLFVRLAERMDKAMFLDGPRFREALSGPIREPACIGCYEAEPDALRRQMRHLFTGTKGPGLPSQKKTDGKLCAALLPHIDYTRGGHTIAWGFKEIFERTDASLFVIIGTSHYSPHRFTLTRKNFKTPLGVVPSDQAYIDRLVSHYGDGLFEDEISHLPEHSIELEVVFLQYLYENVRPFRIVPLVVGSFRDSVHAGSQPKFRPDVASMIEALRKADAETDEPICYLISGDLAHIGPKFDDPEPVSEPFLNHSYQQDQAILKQTEVADPAGFFQVIADEDDRRRICGLPPTYTLLEAIHPKKGKLLHYEQYVHPRGHESVSFASVAFYG
jgi:AmmeMemoRadiSam system protein B